ncbi:MAG: hypothetical protein HRT87_04340, partial [Legionellales bacterium]|nr:hypothetical protein [Legionellales bacterium]
MKKFNLILNSIILFTSCAFADGVITVKNTTALNAFCRGHIKNKVNKTIKSFYIDVKKRSENAITIEDEIKEKIRNGVYHLELNFQNTPRTKAN